MSSVILSIQINREVTGFKKKNRILTCETIVEAIEYWSNRGGIIGRNGSWFPELNWNTPKKKLDNIKFIRGKQHINLMPSSLYPFFGSFRFLAMERKESVFSN